MNKLMEDFSKKPVVPVGRVNGVTGNDDFYEEFSSSSDDDDDLNTEYEQEFLAQEMRRYAHQHNEAMQDEGNMYEVEGVEGMEYRNNPLNIYSSYNFGVRSSRKELPIDSFKNKILDMLKVNNILVIQGPTGCGKTTQVPQYILDQCMEKKEYCNIVVTQPRRIATITVAKRVCQERCWTLGTVCGYQVGLEKKTHPDMILTYVTTGVLLQKLIQSKSLNQYTHIIIDEVHERNQDLDFLLLIVRRFYYTVSPKTKVILMSATIDAEEFAYYFRIHTFERPIPAPIIQVDKRSNFKNTIFYLDNLGPAVLHTKCLDLCFDIDRPEIPVKMWELFVFLVSIIDKLDEVDPATNKKIIGSILVFLPGIHEIEEAIRRLELETVGDRSRENRDGTSKPKWQIVPLHSCLPSDEQAAAFLPPEEGHRKIILSTNIAESSVTVPDTYYVIDFCQTKVMTVDPVTKYMSLKLEWASHVNCDQRAGRVGRVANGRVYRLVTRSFYFDKMSDRSIPEILRAPLERVVLQAKMLNLIESPQQILALAISPPNLKSIEVTILTLKELGGLLQTCRGSYTNYDGDISFLGTVMAQLPVDVRLTKFIVLGHLFSCLKEAIIIAAGCSIQNIFAIPFQQKLNAYRKQLLWADGSFSDLIALLNLYQVWQSLKRDNQFDSYRAEQQWCAKNLVNFKGLREWHLLVTEITQRLEYMHIANIQGQLHLNQHEKPLILKIITAGAFYPNFFIKQPDENLMDEREAVKAVGGRNPYHTVYLTGMDTSQPGPLYISHIKDLFKNDRGVERDMLVGFDGSSKIYIEFKSFDSNSDNITVVVNGRQMIKDIIGHIPTAVYLAIRKRQLKYPFPLKLLPLQEAWSFAKSRGIERKTTLQRLEDASNLYNILHDTEKNCFSEETEFNPIPSLDIEWITVKITEFIDAGHFWVNTLESEHYLAAMESMNNVVLHGVLASGEPIELGKLYAAKYVEDDKYYRCKVISMGPQMTQVIFVDYGNIQQVKPNDLCVLPSDPAYKVPPLGVECVLHGIKPSAKTNQMGVWSDSVNNYWRNELFGFLLFGKVHSVVDNVVSLELYKSAKRETTINQIMIEYGHAEQAMESFLSKEDHEKRMQVIRADNPSQEAFRLSFDKVQNYSDIEAPRIDSRSATNTIELKGPFSPLEMKIHGLIVSAGDKTVDIEGSSVNTVLLDDNPTNYHTRLLVAGCVSQSQLGNKLKLRQTTLMPNVPGLPMLLALIFCPTMKPKLTDDGTRVASILCGLGYNIYTNKPYYPDHDLNLVLDTTLTEKDINNINKIRFAMNQGINLMHRISLKMASTDEMIRTQYSLKKELIDLVTQSFRRTPVERVNVKYANSWSKSNVEALILKSAAEQDGGDIWPLLWFVKLRTIPGFNPNTSKNLDDLDLMARSMMPVKDATCLLCNTALLTIHDVRFHLISEIHKNRLKDYLDSMKD